MDLTQEKYFKENTKTSLLEIQQLANKLLSLTWEIRLGGGSIKQVKLTGWKFEFNNRKRAAGLCHYGKKTIYISSFLLEQNLDKSAEFENTIRHELAHAIDCALGYRSNHGPLWKSIARQVLCTGDRCFSTAVIQTKVKTKYTLTCTNCKKEYPSHRLKKRLSACTDCCNAYNYGRFSYKYLLNPTRNY